MSKTCGYLGCRQDATYVIDHVKHGKRTVCDTHAEDHAIIRRVEQ